MTLEECFKAAGEKFPFDLRLYRDGNWVEVKIENENDYQVIGKLLNFLQCGDLKLVEPEPEREFLWEEKSKHVGFWVPMYWMTEEEAEKRIKDSGLQYRKSSICENGRVRE